MDAGEVVGVLFAEVAHHRREEPAGERAVMPACDRRRGAFLPVGKHDHLVGMLPRPPAARLQLDARDEQRLRIDGQDFVAVIVEFAPVVRLVVRPDRLRRHERDEVHARLRRQLHLVGERVVPLERPARVDAAAAGVDARRERHVRLRRLRLERDAVGVPRHERRPLRIAVEVRRPLRPAHLRPARHAQATVLEFGVSRRVVVENRPGLRERFGRRERRRVEVVRPCLRIDNAHVAEQHLHIPTRRNPQVQGARIARLRRHLERKRLPFRPGDDWTVPVPSPEHARTNRPPVHVNLRHARRTRFHAHCHGGRCRQTSGNRENHQD